jgi:hypothetical protein
MLKTLAQLFKCLVACLLMPSLPGQKMMDVDGLG